MQSVELLADALHCCSLKGPFSSEASMLPESSAGLLNLIVLPIVPNVEVDFGTDL